VVVSMIAAPLMNEADCLARQLRTKHHRNEPPRPRRSACRANTEGLPTFQ